MKAEKVLYTAVGAPLVSYRKASERVADMRTRFTKEANSMTKTASKRMSLWATEGEKMINKLSDAKVVDDIASRVDFDQVSTQVNKLRDQLEDLLATWRSSFRPEKLPTVKVEASSEGVKFQTIPAKKATAKSTAAKKTGARKATTAKKATTVKATVKKTGAKKTTGVKASVTKATTAKRPAAKKAAGTRTTGVKKATAAKKVAVNA